MKVVEDRAVFFGVGLMFISQEYFNHLAIENHQLISPSSMITFSTATSSSTFFSFVRNWDKNGSR